MVSVLQSLFDIIKDGLPIACFIFGAFGFVGLLIFSCILLIENLAGWGLFLSLIMFFLVFAALGGLSIRE
jgi:hypothetical protein